ncbi:hypothetical protein M408DRAFT_179155 [Serendipita vermifera MAFF 305830]|uniref:Uncharacterized protein n=1 Tax=Serendipita vermifera MAFF 305830 TaxID=933852 RepID=A0A0C2XC12_SERVB|nr:hypothetical protein M408DRAFT_179155 [Serendipita vermifera MAFF 305830]
MPHFQSLETGGGTCSRRTRHSLSKRTAHHLPLQCFVSLLNANPSKSLFSVGSPAYTPTLAVDTNVRIMIYPTSRLHGWSIGANRTLNSVMASPFVTTFTKF